MTFLFIAFARFLSFNPVLVIDVHSFTNLFFHSVIHFFPLISISLLDSYELANLILVKVYSLHSFIQHLQTFTFHHLPSLKNDFSIFSYAVTCTCTITCLYNHLVYIFQGFMTLLIHFLIIHKQAMSKLYISLSWLSHIVSFGSLE